MSKPCFLFSSSCGIKFISRVHDFPFIIVCVYFAPSLLTNSFFNFRIGWLTFFPCLKGYLYILLSVCGESEILDIKIGKLISGNLVAWVNGQGWYQWPFCVLSQVRGLLRKIVTQRIFGFGEEEFL